MKSMKTIAVLALIACIVIAVCFLRPSRKQDLTLLSGTKGGTYEALALLTKDVLEKPDERPVGLIKILESRGSVENLQRVRDWCPQAGNLFGYVSGAVIMNAGDDLKQNVSAVARLDTLFIQVVVSSQHTNLMTLSDLLTTIDPPELLVTKNDIFTAELLRELVALSTNSSGQKVAAEFKITEVSSYDDAVALLTNRETRELEGKVVAALFVSALRTPAVTDLLAAGNYKLLSLHKAAAQLKTGNVPEQLEQVLSKVSQNKLIATIPADRYPNQKDPVTTIVMRAYLVCPTGLDQEIVEFVATAIYESLGYMKILHSGTEQLRPDDMFTIPSYLNLGKHPGAQKVEDHTREELLIMTGAFGGQYYKIGRLLKDELAAMGTRATVSHSEGSFENARTLLDRTQHPGPIVAIMQEDAAILSKLGRTNPVYQVQPLPLRTAPPAANIEPVRDLVQLGTLHSEKMHVLVKKQILNQSTNQDSKGFTLKNLSGRSVGVGASMSGSQLTSRRILGHVFEGSPDNKWPILRPDIPVNKMMDMVGSDSEESLDAAMFVAYVPSSLVQRALNRGRVGLVAIEGNLRHQIPGLAPSSINKSAYGDHEEIATVETRAILVARDDLDDNLAETIAEALDRATYFAYGDSFKPGALVRGHRILIPFHEGAKKYYEKKGYLSAPQPWWRTWLPLLLGVTTVAKIVHSISKQIFTAQLKADIVSAVTMAPSAETISKLLSSREDARRRVRLGWWNPKSVSLDKWNAWRKLLDDRKAQIEREEASAAHRDMLNSNPPKDEIYKRLRRLLHDEMLLAEDYERLRKFNEERIVRQEGLTVPKT